MEWGSSGVRKRKEEVFKTEQWSLLNPGNILWVVGIFILLFLESNARLVPFLPFLGVW